MPSSHIKEEFLAKAPLCLSHLILAWKLECYFVPILAKNLATFLDLGPRTWGTSDYKIVYSHNGGTLMGCELLMAAVNSTMIP